MVYIYITETPIAFEQLPFDIQLASAATKQADKLPDNSVWSVYEDRQQNIWLGTHNAGLLHFDRAHTSIKLLRLWQAMINR